MPSPFLAICQKRRDSSIASSLDRTSISAKLMIDVRSKEEAIELARRFWQIARDGEGAIRQVYGPE